MTNGGATVSFDATRAVWAARDSGTLKGGPRLLVALAMADRAHKVTGDLMASTRGLSARAGVSQPTVVATQRDLIMAGLAECTERGIGTRPSRWRWLTTGQTQAGDNQAERETSKALTNGQRATRNRQRATSDALARKEKSETRTSVLTRESEPCGQPADVRPAGVTAAADIPGNVATLRDALDGRGRGRNGEGSGVTAGPAPALDGLAELTAFMAADA